MIRNHSRVEKRAAYTLIELMIVVLIIAVLVSLLLAGITSVTRKIPQVQTSTEISELGVALQAFKADYNLADPPPSYLVLPENVSADSLKLIGPSGVFLQKVFGRTLQGTGPNNWVDWNGNGIQDGPHYLEGEQCLVFYLGGIPTAPGLTGFAPQGFSTNNMNPSTPSGKRKGPYFTFQTSRLVPIQVINSAATSLSPYHPVYIDAWQVKSARHPAPYANGIPYAYFSSQGLNNTGYLTNRSLVGTPQFPVLDCYHIGAHPYWTAQPTVLSTIFTNSNTYQIISAGKNGVFGNGYWNPTSGPLIPGTNPPKPDANGADDQSNFSSGLLGAGQS